MPSTLNTETAHDLAALVDTVIGSRRSIHQFLGTQLGLEEVQHLLALASRAPSGTNTQPWRVHAVSGEALRRLCAAMLKAHFEEPDAHDYGYNYYPEEMFGRYAERQREYWEAFWGTHQVPRSDTERSRQIISQNYNFFGAPVGLIYTIDEGLEVGSWFDYGMFVCNVMIGARARGWDTCPQVSVAKYHKIIRQLLSIAPSEIVICGMALGHADPKARINQLRMQRDPLEQFASFHGFEPATTEVTQ